MLWFKIIEVYVYVIVKKVVWILRMGVLCGVIEIIIRLINKLCRILLWGKKNCFLGGGWNGVGVVFCVNYGKFEDWGVGMNLILMVFVVY